MENWRFKTEEELTNEFGKGWRYEHNDGWNPQMDEVLGKNIPKHYYNNCLNNWDLDLTPKNAYRSYTFHNMMYTKETINKFKNGKMIIKNGLLKGY